MKKFLLTGLLLAAFCSANLWAQHYPFAHWGVKAGPNYSGLRSYQQEIYQAYPELPPDLRFTNEPYFRFHAGTYAQIFLSEKLQVLTETSFSLQGYHFKAPYLTNTVDLHIKQTYIQLPVLLQYRIYKGLALTTGPQLGYLAKGELTARYGEIEEKRKAKFTAFELAWSAGVSYWLPKSSFGLYMRYNAGLTNINNDPDRQYTLRNQVVQAGLCYQLARIESGGIKFGR